MGHEWIYKKVQELVKQFNTRDPLELAGFLGVQVKVMRETKSLLGVYSVISGCPYIFIPENVGYLKKTILAHELGHHELHADHVKEGAAFHENRVFYPMTPLELEANIFAAHLLIPDEEIYQLIREAEDDRELAGLLEVDLNLLHLKISEMAKMRLLQMDHHIDRPDSTFLKEYEPKSNW